MMEDHNLVDFEIVSTLKVKGWHGTHLGDINKLKYGEWVFEATWHEITSQQLDQIADKIKELNEG